MDKAERERFEAWGKSQGTPEDGWWFRQLDDGGYSSGVSDVAWRAWQARAKLPASAPSVDEQLLAAITDFRKAFVIAVGEKSPFAKLALGNIDRAVQQVEASKAETIPGEVERVTMERFVVVLGVPAHDDATHDCDAMGCGRAHVLARIPRV